MSGTYLIVLLFVLSAYLAYSDVFTSIDCGSSDDYTDDKLIVWQRDDTFINNGVAQTVQTKNSFSPVMDSLRVFTTRKKNCYTFEVEAGGHVLVRASFFYGNYDKKSSPPTFDLHIDGNFWMTVETSITDLIYSEVIYPVSSDLLSVCVAQTEPDQFPFISALEVRSLAKTMYSKVDANFMLVSKTRVSYGTENEIRFADDVYDRIWDPSQIGDGLLTVQNDAIFISNDVEDIPPQKVLQNAITTGTTSQYISIGQKFSTKTQIYITMYFSEVTQLDSTDERSFIVYQDNVSISDIIIPPYNSVYEFSSGNITVSSDTVFTVTATTNSTLPPLVNAMEVYYVSDSLTEGTNADDVKGLKSLLNNFDVLQEWNGTEPCLPARYTWDWLNCSTDSSPRVTSLDLSSFGLSGLLPDFSSMTALETIDLRNNTLKGAIPDFLGTLPNLKELNLADNQFSGPIPYSLSRNNKIKLVVTGNPDVCASGKSCQVLDSPTTSNDSPTTFTTARTSKKSKSKVPVILGTTIPIFIIFWVIVAVLAICNHKRRSSAVGTAGAGHNDPNGTPQSQSTMLGKFGEAMENEMKQNLQPDNVTVDFSDQTDHQPSSQGNDH